MNKPDVVYIELNNWFYGRDYPPDENLANWVVKGRFNDEKWVKKNKLCVVAGLIDMSFNWCITAPCAWVEKNCPKLLTDETYTYETITRYMGEETTTQHVKHYSDFVKHPDEDDPDGTPVGQFDWSFLEYCAANIGITENNEYWGESEEDEEDEEDE